MATIQSTIELYDSFSPVLYNVMDAVNLTIASVEHMQQSLGANMDMTSLDGAVESIHQAEAAMAAMNEQMVNVGNHVNSNIDRQNNFNNSLQDANGYAGNLVNTIKRIGGAYLTLQGVQKVLNLSDSITSTNARLKLVNEMNGSLQTQEELQNAIFASAERSRATYSATADTIAKLGIQASKAFSGTDEIIAFTELMNKNFVVGGAETTAQTAAMYQLTQAMASGRLQGDEYRSIIENAPLLANAIEDYMVNVQQAEGNMKDWAAEGMLTADVIKAALFTTAGEIDERFEQMPMTFGQIWTSISNRALRAFQPFLQRLNDIANSDRFNSMVDGAVGALAVLGAAATEVIDLMVSGAAFIHDNWAFIGPLFYAIAFAVGVYTAAVAFNSIALKINNTLSRIAAIRSAAHGEAVAAERLATLGMTEAQLKLNAAMYASPITWILIGIFAIIAAIYIVTAIINKVCDVSISATGMIVGALYELRAVIINIGLFIDNVFFGIMNVLDVVLSACGNGFINFGLLVDNIALGIWEVIKAVAENIAIAFKNAINSSKAIFYGLAAVAFDVISKIAEALNKLPFIEFDVAGLDAKAAEYAAKSAEAANNISDYTSISDAWDKGFNTYDYLDTGSLSDISDAWNKGFNTYDYMNLDDEFDLGYKAGQNLANKLKSIFTPEEDDKTKDYTDLLNGLEAINNNTGSTADNTADIADALEITEEDLKYLRDIAEREVIDRTVLKSVTIDMSGMTNKVENMQDLDGISTYLAKSLRQQMEVSMEGA